MEQNEKLVLLEFVRDYGNILLNIMEKPQGSINYEHDKGYMKGIIKAHQELLKLSEGYGERKKEAIKGS